MMAGETIRILRTTDRIAPDGTWSVDDPADLPIEEARELVASGRAKLAPGCAFPEETGVAPAMETASLDAGEPPAGEPKTRAPARKRG